MAMTKSLSTTQDLQHNFRSLHSCKSSNAAKRCGVVESPEAGHSLPADRQVPNKPRHGSSFNRVK